MESKICTQCNEEKFINIFAKKFSECTDFNSKRGIKRDYESKNELSNQQNVSH